jgi:hypothetical protein
VEKLAIIAFLVIGLPASLVYWSLRLLWEFEASEGERERKKREECANRRLAKCGHEIGPDSEEVEYCSRCLELMATRCAFCGRRISIGDQVGICAPKSVAELPQFGEPCSAAPLEFVVCQRLECAKKEKAAGVWSPPGRIERSFQKEKAE